MKEETQRGSIKEPSLKGCTSEQTTAKLMKEVKQLQALSVDIRVKLLVYSSRKRYKSQLVEQNSDIQDPIPVITSRKALTNL